MLRKTLSLLVSGEYSIDLKPIDSALSAIFSHKWSVLHSLMSQEYDSLKKMILECVCRFIKQLIKVVGTGCMNPVFIRIIKATVTNCGFSVSTNSMLRKYLEAIGSSATGLVYEYISANELVSKTFEQLSLMTCGETVTLGLCIKNKKKKIGNGHQRKHHKVVMKKTENKKLKSMTADLTERGESSLVHSNIRLIIQYFVSNPVTVVDLDIFYTLQIHKLETEIQFSLVQLFVYYSISQKKFVKKLRIVLSNMVKFTEFRNTVRHYLFLLDNTYNS